MNLVQVANALIGKQDNPVRSRRRDSKAIEAADIAAATGKPGRPIDKRIRRKNLSASAGRPACAVDTNNLTEMGGVVQSTQGRNHSTFLRILWYTTTTPFNHRLEGFLLVRSDKSKGGLYAHGLTILYSVNNIKRYVFVPYRRIKMNKKIIAILAVVVAFVLLYAGYQTFLAPKGAEGSKEITIEIKIEKEDIDKTFTYKTDLEFVTDLLKEKQEELGASMDSTDFGTMITGMIDYKADPAANEFFLFQINGVDAAVGTDDTPIQDGETYTFVLSTW